MENGLPVFELPGGNVLLVVEGRTVDGLPPAIGAYTNPPNPMDGRPDIQIETTQPLGKGSAWVCDDGFHAPPMDGGGVYAIPSPDFSFTSTITNALNDFGCRFEYHIKGDQSTYCGDLATPCFPSQCVNGNCIAVSGGSQAEFVGKTLNLDSFNAGDSLVTVRLRDENGNIGPTAQIVVRVTTPTPTR